MKNINRARLCACLSGMSENNPNYTALIKKIKKTPHFQRKYCAAGCGFKTTEGCVSFHEKQHNEMKLPKK
eukprot:634211-Ditylum_brightwellii.AAC.1